MSDRSEIEPRVGSLDSLGAAASTLCAIHCATLPLVVSLLPSIGLSFLADESFEWSLLGLVLLLGVSCLLTGYPRHRLAWIPALFAAGLAILVGGRIAEASGVEAEASILAISVLGGLLIAAAHLANRRCCRLCGAGRASETVVGR